MIYLDSNTNLIEIPKHQNVFELEFGLQLINTVSNDVFEFPNLTDKADSELLYHFEISPELMTSLIDGEYVYKVITKSTGEVVEIGLVQFGDYDKSIEQHEKSNKIVQYDG